MASFIAVHGFPASLRDLMRDLGTCSTSTNVMSDGHSGHLDYLRAKGLVERSAPAKKRSWRITDAGYRSLGLPAARPITPKRSVSPATGTVDLGSRCPDCGVQLFGGLTHCAEHRSAA